MKKAAARRVGSIWRAPAVRAVAGLMLAACVAFPGAEGIAQQPAAAPTPQQRVAYLKQWLQESQARMRSYVWVETTTVRKDGEVKSQGQKKCFYAPDGTLQKVPISQDSGKSSGLPGILPPGRLLEKMEEHKKQETQEYMQDVVQLVHAYLPPNPALIQQAVDAGRFGIDIVKPGVDVRLNFSGYLKSGDQLGVDVNPDTNQLLGLHVSSYLDNPGDAVTLDASMGVLPDGTIYMATANLTATAKGVTVTIQNANFTKGGG
jgi:hypothetical protein